mmetsp:Transcript_84488/g.219993  ORF Transcript_84488/g.219993 Transcript_84488/m.219993 type:complete len:598 (-) Transcript_84488:25-1818(-)
MVRSPTRTLLGLGNLEGMPETSKMEEEVRMAEMESKLREMVMDMVRPSVHKIANCKSDMEELFAMLKLQGNQLQEIAAEIQLTSERSNLILDFKHRLDDSADRLSRLDSRLSLHERDVWDRVESLEHKNDMQSGFNSTTDRTLERVMQDFDVVHTQLRRLSDALDAAVMENRNLLNAEAASFKASMMEVTEELHRFHDEVWGPEDCESEIMAPSLRRLDFQTRKIQVRCADMAADLTALRKLDLQMLSVTREQAVVNDTVQDLSVLATDCRDRVIKISIDTKQESKMAANRMAAFTASLMKDVRSSVEHEVQSLKSMHSDMEKFVVQSQASVDSLEQSVKGIADQVSASLKEVHVDLESMETRRRRDKQALQDNIQSVQSRLGSALEAAEGTLRGLEHISSVVSMALQGERMSVAMDVQDFVDRKTTPYVGIRETARATKSWEARNKEGLDPTMLGRLMYEPKQVSFQGSNFERSQLCALREKVIHSAQEMLLQGPAMPSSPRRRKLMDSAATAAAPIVPGALGVTAELPPMGRRSAQGGVSRPGSRGQPSARGSPQPDRGDGPGSGMGQELGIVGVHADSTRMEGTHLPALTAAAY